MAQPRLRIDRRDQASRLRELARRNLRGALTLAITSGKGGVGKSNVAVNLSICLAARGVRVTLVDVDVGLANADLLMNVQPRYTLSHVLSGTRSIEAVCIDGPCGVRFVPGTSGRQDLADLSKFDRENLIAQFRKLHRDTDIVVLDCGAGISTNVIGFARAADQVLVVTTPQPTALTDAYATIKVLNRDGYANKLGLFVNMANSRAEAQAAHGRLAGVAQRFLNYSVAYDGYMLQDTSVALAVTERCPFVIRDPGSGASACIAALAEGLAHSCRQPPARRSLLRRVAGLFV